MESMYYARRMHVCSLCYVHVCTRYVHVGRPRRREDSRFPRLSHAHYRVAPTRK